MKPFVLRVCSFYRPGWCLVGKGTLRSLASVWSRRESLSPRDLRQKSSCLNFSNLWLWHWSIYLCHPSVLDSVLREKGSQGKVPIQGTWMWGMNRYVRCEQVCALETPAGEGDGLHGVCEGHRWVVRSVCPTRWERMGFHQARVAELGARGVVLFLTHPDWGKPGVLRFARYCPPFNLQAPSFWPGKFQNVLILLANELFHETCFPAH